MLLRDNDWNKPQAQAAFDQVERHWRTQARGRPLVVAAPPAEGIERIDLLKIDGSFVRDITRNRISESMVAAITQVAKVMELETIAEYVENEETRKLITDLGVDFAQGYIIGKPAPLQNLVADLSDLPSSSTA